MKEKWIKIYNLIGLLVCFALASHAQQVFRKQAPLNTVPADGFYQVNLSPALTAWLQPDLRDIRLLNKDGQQVPYILKTDQQALQEKPLPSPALRQTDSADKHSYIKINFNSPFFIDRLIITVKGPRFFQRQAFIYNDAARGRELQKAFTISSGAETTVPLMTKTAQLLLVIKNDDNPVLQVQAVRAEQLNRYLLAYLEKENNYRLVFQDSLAAAPQYDLAVFTDSIKQQTTTLQHGAIQANIAEGPMATFKRDDNKWMIWVAIGLAIFILLLLTYRLMGEIKKKQ
ncbi:MAG TPA: DUF3999 family protein [Chitinophagaceae bacterium]|nr:DUF3999 family protein [Chitinophagaceae bacterium]